MYNEKFVVSVKVDNKIIREEKDFIKLPFGTEYTIFLKNLNSRDAKVTVNIDGDNVTDGGIIIRANTSVDLTGFIYNGKITNAFKFIEKTKQISTYRGDKIDDGFIRVEYTFKKADPVISLDNFINTYYSTPPPVTLYPKWDYNQGPIFTSCTSNMRSVQGFAPQQDTLLMPETSMNNSFYSSAILDPVYDDGITVKGTEIDEQLETAIIGDLENNSHVIVMKIKGFKKYGRKVTKITTTKQKIICNVCGNLNRSNFKFCSNCGSFLE